MPDDLFHTSEPTSDSTAAAGESPTDAVQLELLPGQHEQTVVSPAELQRQRLDGLAQEMLELKLVLLSDTDNVGRDLDRLRRQVNGLTGIVIMAIALLSGVMIWLAVGLRTEQAELSQRVAAIATDSVALDRIQELETTTSELAQGRDEIEALETRLDRIVNDLPTEVEADIEAVQTQITELENQMSEVSDQINTRRQTISILATALQDLIAEEEAIAIDGEDTNETQPDAEPNNTGVPESESSDTETAEDNNS
jgi:hypothetical protein